MDVELTQEQAQQLNPLFETVANADRMGLTGMLVAQVWRSRETGRAHMRVGFVKNHQAKQLVEKSTQPVPTSKEAK